MNREIKFRAWDIVLKRWNLSVCIDCFGNIQEYKYNGHSYNAKYADEYNEDEKGDVEKDGNLRFIINRYTGVKDREGKEIYEGDIVKILDETGSIFYNTSQASFDFLYTSEECEALGDSDPQDIETIGNIYENPNLIEGYDS